ncbi:MAG: hypothetical protein AB1742_15185 [bacterium]
MKIYVIAANTFREAFKDRLILGLLAAGILLILSSVVMAELAYVQRVKVISDVGLAVITLTGLIMAIFSGSNLFARELEQKRVCSILSKPVPRYQLVVGKYAGTVFSLTFNLVIMALFLIGLLYADSRTWEFDLLKAVALIEAELMVVAAVALLFSTFTTSILSVFYTLLILIAGHMIEDIKAYWQIKSLVGRIFTKLVYYVVPNLDNFNVKPEVVHNVPVPPAVLAHACLYGALYIVVIVAAAVWLFQYRDLD